MQVRDVVFLCKSDSSQSNLNGRLDLYYLISESLNLEGGKKKKEIRENNKTRED